MILLNPPHQSRCPPLKNEAPPLKSKAIFQEMIHGKKTRKNWKLSLVLVFLS